MKVEDTEQNSGRCVCPGCPTYDECMRAGSGRLFCSRGATECDPKARGCDCPECLVWEEYDLGTMYFCTDGAAA